MSWSFTNSRGHVITTENAVDAEKYRHDPGFTEVIDTPPADPADAYADPSWTKKKLEAEIEARDDAAGDDEPFIEVEAPGNKAELIAALVADDARRASADADPNDPDA